MRLDWNIAFSFDQFYVNDFVENEWKCSNFADEVKWTNLQTP